ncbi:MAG TPA: NAD(P)/FAD-dependent oxidoreductase [Polyangiaceae bacterium]|nr:NAD(P)/FAD-dependent oxidoreductase [Polyangiaceae bacterium]
MTRPFDVLVIGAGFGGLASALTLGELGARVCLCEMLKYPGGCASTFTKAGFRFDAGATLLSGLAEPQLFGRWLSKYSPETRIEWSDRLIDFRSGPLRLDVGRSRERLVDALGSLPGAPEQRIREFFSVQKVVADALWPLLDDATLLPPISAPMLARHARRLREYARIAPYLGRPLVNVMRAHRVDDFLPLRLYVDALCQITVQCGAAEAEAPIALSAMDYVFRGTAHVHGGVGNLAEALLAAARRVGVEVRMPNRVSALRFDPRYGYRAITRGGEIRARAVVSNLLPSAVSRLLGDPTLPPELRDMQTAVDDGWGAAMVYGVASDPTGAPPEAHHLQLVDDERAALCEGNHVFLSISGRDETQRAPLGKRTFTASTHVPLSAVRAIGSNDEVGRYISEIQSRMLRTVRRRAPLWADAVERFWTASPRTFERFVGRPEGAVGGARRVAGLHNYHHMGPSELRPNLWLVGDTVFPGQSALATAVGGVRTAHVTARRLNI